MTWPAHPIGSRYQPSYAGIPTFFRSPYGEIGDLTSGDIAILGAPFDTSIGLGRHGTRYGPRAIREESCYFASFYCSMPDRTLVDLELGHGFRIPDPLPLVDLGDADVFPLDVDATTDSVAAAVRAVVERGALPILLGGDHHLVYPAFKGAAEALRARNPDVRIGHLHIDSHTDLFDELSFTGSYNHATSVRRITECPGISIRHMAWIGLNGRLVSKEQYDFASAKDLCLITSAAVQGDDWETVIRGAIERVSAADYVYVSADIDAVDGSEASGTGSAIFEGMSAGRFLRLLELVGGIPNLIGFDLCEVCPRLDPTGR
jgi:arginase family enzyme